LSGDCVNDLINIAKLHPRCDRMSKINKQRSRHYKWQDVCDGWPLVETDELSVKQEKMPPKTCEVRHFHREARQFFYVLSGHLSMEIDGTLVILGANDGLEVAPKTRHQARNESAEPVEFLVVSTPTTTNDKHLVE